MNIRLVVSFACVQAAISFAPQTTVRPVDIWTLNALGALVKKAKEAELRQYVADGVPDNVMAEYNALKEKVDSVDLENQQPGPLQQALTKRKGTITVIAEYKRKLSEAESGYIDQVFDPELLSPVFREFGASAVAVLADERMGGCTYADLAAFVEEQRRAKNEVPGPIPVINNDLIVDEIQIARSAVENVAAVVLPFELVQDNLVVLLKATLAAGLEPIVAVSSPEDAQVAVDQGARILSVVQLPDNDDKVAVIENLQVPEGQQVCKIANIPAEDNKQFQEIEDAWAMRDKGFQSVWVGEALYKSGADETEHPGAIIKSMKAKSSLKWASPKAKSGRGEGAREYLGDIMM